MILRKSKHSITLSVTALTNKHKSSGKSNSEPSMDFASSSSSEVHELFVHVLTNMNLRVFSCRCSTSSILASESNPLTAKSSLKDSSI